jgi:hypothetical protein
VTAAGCSFRGRSLRLYLHLRIGLTPLCSAHPRGPVTLLYPQTSPRPDKRTPGANTSLILLIMMPPQKGIETIGHSGRK